MKYFISSDIHGHFDEWMKVLKEKEYDQNDHNHILIVAGDMFDRGSQCREVLEFIYPLVQKNKAIVLKGNHEVFLEDLFQRNFRSVNWNIEHNGFLYTIESLSGIRFTNIDDMIKQIKDNYPFLEEWISSLPYYFELNEYIITHAGLDLTKKNWKEGNWKKAVWTYPEEFFQFDLVRDYHFTKKVIVGHRITASLRRYFMNQNELDFSIYYHPDGQKIGIDGGSYWSKQINVLVIEE